jgi:repressor LexA
MLTWRQRQILQVINDYTAVHGCSPSSREIAQGVGLASPASVAYHLRQLRAAGLVTYDDRSPRTVKVLRPGSQEITVPEKPEEMIWVPVAGQIAAGSPILAQQSIEGYWALPRELVGPGEGLFLLKIVGDSMTGVGIFDGDLVVIHPLLQPPRDGDIVAATVDGVEPEGTVKTYRKVGRQVWLMPHNPAYVPIPGDKAQIAGKVTAVLRRV